MKTLLISALLTLSLSLNAQVFLYKNATKSVKTTEGKAVTNSYTGYLVLSGNGQLAAVIAQAKTKKFWTVYPDDIQIDYVKASATKEYMLLCQATSSYSDGVPDKYEMETLKAKGLLYSVNVGLPQTWRIPKTFTQSSFGVHPGTNSFTTVLIEETGTVTLDLTRTVAANRAGDDFYDAIARCEMIYSNAGYIWDE